MSGVSGIGVSLLFVLFVAYVEVWTDQVAYTAPWT